MSTPMFGPTGLPMFGSGGAPMFCTPGNCCGGGRCSDEEVDTSADTDAYSLDGTDTGWTLSTDWTVDTNIAGTQPSPTTFPTRYANLPRQPIPVVTVEATLEALVDRFATFGIQVADARLYARRTLGGYGSSMSPTDNHAISGSSWSLGDVLKITLTELSSDVGAGTGSYKAEFYVNGSLIDTLGPTTLTLKDCVISHGVVSTPGGFGSGVSSFSSYDYSSNW